VFSYLRTREHAFQHPIDDRESIPHAESVVKVIAEQCREVATGGAESVVVKRMQSVLNFMRNETSNVSQLRACESSSFVHTACVLFCMHFSL